MDFVWLPGRLSFHLPFFKTNIGGGRAGGGGTLDPPLLRLVTSRLKFSQLIKIEKNSMTTILFLRLYSYLFCGLDFDRILA